MSGAVKLRSSLPLSTSHSRTVLSSAPLATQRPSGLTATARAGSEWPV
jgi:hypothetical protein